MLEREPLERAGRRRPSSTPTATRASGTAWTPTRTRSSSTTSGRRARRRGRRWAEAERRGEPRARHRRPRLRRLAPGAGAAGAGRGGSRPRPARAADRRRRRDRPSGLDLLGIRERGRAGRGRPARRRGGRGGGRRLRLGLPPRRADDRRRRPRIAAGDVRGQRARAPGTSSRPAARTDVERVVFASSDKAYGASPELPYREDFPLRAAFPYDASKAAADIVARSYAHAYGLPLAVTRFANVYGGGDLNFSRLIPETVVAVLDGRRRRSAPTAAPSATSSTSTTRSPPIWRSPRRSGRTGRGRGLQRRRRAAALGARGRRADRRRGRRRSRARLPGQGQPRRRDRPPVRRLDQAARADRLAPRGRALQTACAARSSGTASTPRHVRGPKSRHDETERVRDRDPGGSRRRDRLRWRVVVRRLVAWPPGKRCRTLDRSGGSGPTGARPPARCGGRTQKADNGRPRAQVPQGVPLDTRSARVRKAIADLLHPESKGHGDGESSRSEAAERGECRPPRRPRNPRAASPCRPRTTTAARPARIEGAPIMTAAPASSKC